MLDNRGRREAPLNFLKVSISLDVSESNILLRDF